MKSKIVEFKDEISGKTLYVETRMLEDGKTETRSSSNPKVFEQQPGNYIEYKSILDAAEDIIKNGFKAVKEEVVTSKGIKTTYLEEDFNKSLIKKIEEREQLKKELDINNNIER
jgi:hypothetical protein